MTLLDVLRTTGVRKGGSDGTEDFGAFYSGHVTITPIKLDWTDQTALSEVGKWGLTEGK
jgi:broad specificity polyphosphatase/5'/3'-nucleotidase SurE